MNGDKLSNYIYCHANLSTQTSAKIDERGRTDKTVKINAATIKC